MKSQITEKWYIRVGIAIILIGAISALLLREDLLPMFSVEKVRAFVSSSGAFAPLVYIGIMVFAVIVSQIPNAPLAVAAGTIFGPLLGGLYSLVGGFLGALACFFIARSLGVVFVRRVFGKTLHFCDRCNDTFIGLTIFFARLLPFFSFDLISYCAGLTNLRARTFLIATLFGMTPMTFLFSYLGGFILINPTLSAILTGFLIVMLFGAPLLIRKFNILGLRERILIR